MFGNKDNRRADKFTKAKAHFDTGKYQQRGKYAYKAPKDRVPYDGDRRVNKATAEETVLILETGTYALGENTIDFSEELNRAVSGTVTYGPYDAVPFSDAIQKVDTVFKVVKDTSVQTILNLREDDPNCRLCVLNFASAKNPGGGFLSGSQAQEESLARATGLYSCIKDSPMYKANMEDNNYCLYQDYIIYSPDVPVFRDSDDELLEGVETVSIISVPAVNTGEALRQQVPVEVIGDTMLARMDKMFAVLALHDIQCVILGAWGCGVFGGDINVVAENFYTLLTGKYKGVFENVVFSVINKEDHRVLSSYFQE